MPTLALLPAQLDAPSPLATRASLFLSVATSTHTAPTNAPLPLSPLILTLTPPLPSSLVHPSSLHSASTPSMFYPSLCLNVSTPLPTHDISLPPPPPLHNQAPGLSLRDTTHANTDTRDLGGAVPSACPPHSQKYHTLPPPWSPTHPPAGCLLFCSPFPLPLFCPFPHPVAECPPLAQRRTRGRTRTSRRTRGFVPLSAVFAFGFAPTRPPASIWILRLRMHAPPIMKCKK